jgi:predicted O-methyltransferase YrrM
MIKTWRFNPKYIIARVKNYFYFKNNQDLPWMTKDANIFLLNNLRDDMVMLEFGSGRSTQFYATKTKKVYSREHHKEWFDIVKKQIESVTNIEYKFYDDLAIYADTSDIKNNSLDLAVIDGKNRVNCLLNTIPKLKSGGVLVLDNAERYMVYQTSSPAKYLRAERNPRWGEVEELLRKNFWRHETTDNVSDTLFFFKR